MTGQPRKWDQDIICLYDESGLAGAPWAAAGYAIHCYDIINTFGLSQTGDGITVRHNWDAYDEAQNANIISRHQGRAKFLMAFPPCTDLAVSGAAWFEKKRLADPHFQDKAIRLFEVAEQIARALGVPYFLENPVSVASTMFRKPDHSFHPHEYGGYLPPEDIHPTFPDYYPPRDAYPKKTCYWTGGGFIMPEKKPVPCPPGYSTAHLKLGGKSEKTKKIRSTSPRGVAVGVFISNSNKDAHP